MGFYDWVKQFIGVNISNGYVYLFAWKVQEAYYVGTSIALIMIYLIIKLVFRLPALPGEGGRETI